MKHKCIMSRWMRLSGDHPADCIICGKAMSLQEGLDNEEALLWHLGVLKREDGKVVSSPNMNHILKVIRKSILFLLEKEDIE